jgi:hypothetical protein
MINADKLKSEDTLLKIGFHKRFQVFYGCAQFRNDPKLYESTKEGST